MPGWKELKRFCDRDGWELYKDTDHYFYRKTDNDGNIKLTKVSKGSGEFRFAISGQIREQIIFASFVNPAGKDKKPEVIIDLIKQKVFGWSSAV